jgi:ABC-2 type transport system permease protein
MSSLANIVKKEMKELLTKSTLIPVIFMAILFGSMGSLIGGVEEEASALPTVGLVDLDAGVLSDIAFSVANSSADLVYYGTDIDEGLNTLKEQKGLALLVLPSNFSSNILNDTMGNIEIYWIIKGAGLMDSISSVAVDSLLASIRSSISAYLISADTELDPATVLSPISRTETSIFQDKEMEGISPGTLGTLMYSQSFTVPFIIMLIVIMAGGMVISSMGMEKENKTLETLLTLPVSRGAIVAGKLIASALIGLLMAGIYMIGFNYYMTSLQSTSEIDLAKYGLDLGMVDFVLIGISLFVSLLAALALCMVLGTFAKNYKSAQSLTMPITLLAIVPMFVTMFKDFNTLPTAVQVLIFAIPFTHPMMAMRELMFDNYVLVIAGIAYVAIFAIAMVAITVWIFKSDRLLTGSVKKKSRFGFMGGLSFGRR